MLPLVVAARYKGDEGRPIYCPFPGLAEMGGIPRRAQLSMIAAGAGTGKTAFTTAWMLALANDPTGEKYRVMYFSADSDRGTVTSRVGAAVTGWDVSAVDEMLLTNPGAVWQRIAPATAHIGYCFDSPTPESIEREICCYAMTWGEWPTVIVVDNLLDVRGESDGYEGMAETAAWLKNVASETGAAVILLHHVTGTWADGRGPLPVSAVLGKVDKPQRLILTLHKPDDTAIGVSVVKNSNGRADTSGGYVTYIDVDLSRMFFSRQ
jgi:hypothetical protein